VFGLFSLQGLRFLLKLPTTIGLRQGLEPNFLKLLMMPQLVLRGRNTSNMTVEWTPDPLTPQTLPAHAKDFGPACSAHWRLGP
jgi:hypothetical protein